MKCILTLMLTLSIVVGLFLLALSDGLYVLLVKTRLKETLFYASSVLRLAVIFGIAILSFRSEAEFHGVLSVLIGIVLLYQQVNISRMYKLRYSYLRGLNSYLRAYSWLLALLVIFLAGLSWQDATYHSNALAVFSLAAAGASALLAVYHLFTYTMPRLDHFRANSELPSVSILIPARDETEELIACLETVVELDYEKLEILVLDDCSTNPKTSEIIKSFAKQGVRFVSGDEPKEDWLGKNNAYEKLRKEASGEWLLFLGVDIRVNKHSLKNLIERVLNQNIRMASIMPFRDPSSSLTLSSPLRYWWEFAIPRRSIGRPAVLSSSWIIQSKTLRKFGGFKGVSRSVIPERHIAKSLDDEYRFWVASPKYVWLSTDKSLRSQYKTALLHRFPQLKRRIERTALISILFFCFVYGLGVLAARYLPIFVLAMSLLSLSVGVAASASLRFNAYLRGLLALPLLLQELLIINYSLYRYEFTDVLWKGRNVCMPVMRVYKSLPKLPPKKT